MTNSLAGQVVSEATGQWLGFSSAVGLLLISHVDVALET